MGLSHVDRASLTEFFTRTEEDLGAINEKLRVASSSDRTTEQNQALAIEVFRILHTIKGHARLLELSFFENGAHEIENLVDGLASKDARPKAEDFIPVVVRLNQFLRPLLNVNCPIAWS